MQDDVLTPADHEAIEEAVNEISPVADYTAQLQIIHEDLEGLQEVAGYIEGFLIFASVVVLCWFSYKFLRIFF